MEISNNLDQLKMKRLPNKKIRDGVKLNIAKYENKNVEVEEGYIEILKSDVHMVRISDMRDKRKVDRALILDRIFRKKMAKLPTPPGLEEKKGKEELSSITGDNNDFNEESLFRVRVKSLQPAITFEPAKKEDKIEEGPVIGLDNPVIGLDNPVIGETRIIIKKKGKKIELKEAEVAKEVAKEKEPAKKATKKIHVVRPELVDLMSAKIGHKLVINRLPKDRERIISKASSFYMNNRKLYITKLADLFKTYRKTLAENEDAISCKTQSKDKNFELLIHQKIVRDYLNLYTPYRGLLLFHGLGSGKTCTSIALAEGMKSHRRVFVLTPASLKMNFFSELKKCGDALYKKNQFWEFISIEGKPDYVATLSGALQLPADYIKSNKGAWLVDVSKKANFTELAADKQVEIDEQLNQMIRTKYTDINYNGMNNAKMQMLTGDYTRNPFDNSVVIIDEAHNFVSRIVNKLPKTAAGQAKKDAASKKTISYMLYDYLMSATNARVVLLTGTPIINYPNEIGILFNILRGYIKTWTFPVRIVTSQTVNRDRILEMFADENFNTYDYVEYSGNKLTITRNPFGFINDRKRDKVVRRGGKSSNNYTKNNNKNKQNKTKKLLKKLNKVEKQSTEAYELKDGVIKIFDINEMDIEPDASEYAHYKKAYMGEDEPHQGGHLGGVGTEVFDGYNGIYLDETGNMPEHTFVSSIIRILGKNGIEVVESGIEVVNNKCLPDDSETFLDMFIEPGVAKMKNENVFKRRILGLTSYFRSAQEKLLPQYILNEQGGIFHIVRSEMSDYQFGIYEKIRKEEEEHETSNRKKQRKQENKGNELFEVASTYRIFSRACCNFAFPDPPGRPFPDRASKANEEVSENDFDAVSLAQRKQTDDYIDEDNAEEEGEPAADYQTRIVKAMKFLEYNPETPRETEYLTPQSLELYSPKFLSLLENVQDEANRGLHLIYSQFRTIEGIGILRLILEANGFAEFKIRKNAGADSWDIVEKEGSADKPRFVLYTGTETAEEKEMIRNIYNSDWEYVPASITAVLKEKAANNMYGEIIKLLMITSSGAEGINLKNTRFVHIVEPYWHMVRIEQVIGRARRICSHEDLPEELRNIKVFLYLTVLNEQQKTDEKHIELRIRDVSKLDGKTPVTTDETLFESATIKDGINRQILTAIKETAIDCSLYSAGNKTESLVCYGYGKIESNQFGSYPTIGQDMNERDEINERKKKVKLSNITINKIKYAWNEDTNELFDYESMKRAKITGEDLIYIGRLVKESARKFLIDTDIPRT